MALEVIPVEIKKEIQNGDDLTQIFLSSFLGVQDGDIIVIAQKAVSKQEGKVVHLPQVIPSILAVGIASEYGKEPRLVEVILSEARRIVRMDGGVIITQTKHGFVCANSGVDESNLPKDFASLLPDDPDMSAMKFRDGIIKKTGKQVSVLVSDTFGRPFREGQTNVAIGVAGIKPIRDYAGKKDSFGRTLRVTAIAQVDEICSAAELVMKKFANCPFAVVRNFDYDPSDGKIGAILRAENTDLFR